MSEWWRAILPQKHDARFPITRYIESACTVRNVTLSTRRQRVTKMLELTISKEVQVSGNPCFIEYFWVCRHSVCFRFSYKRFGYDGTFVITRNNHKAIISEMITLWDIHDGRYIQSPINLDPFLSNIINFKLSCLFVKIVLFLICKTTPQFQRGCPCMRG